MKMTLAIAALGLTLTSPTLAHADSGAYENGARHIVSTRGYTAGQVPAAGFRDQYFTTSDGCTYSRAQAPGYAPTWHIVVNASRIGGRDRHRGCAGMLGG
ncbi:hypothetical protein [Salipiger sp.]|uniref:hypothetical protein n=1 Tax=Salipiger sp. TaxID=2078585 RepID=UPI003A985751